MILVQVRVSFILVTASYNLGHIFCIWFLLATSELPLHLSGVPTFIIRGFRAAPGACAAQLLHPHPHLHHDKPCPLLQLLRHHEAPLWREADLLGEIENGLLLNHGPQSPGLDPRLLRFCLCHHRLAILLSKVSTFFS